MTSRLDRDCFPEFYAIDTRWSDNDIYGHVNNVQYYSFFDSAVNRFLIEHGGLDIHNDQVVGFVVESKCQYFSPIAYPDTIEIGLSVTKLSNRSVTYQLGVFVQGQPDICAQGHFVHVFVDQASNQSVAIPDQIRQALNSIVISQI
ncbi:acyl-CoA thioesterase [Aliiglaciecola sp.]|nr:acyl-CoA thioesterase [Aliiglaciecola sp.]